MDLIPRTGQLTKLVFEAYQTAEFRQRVEGIPAYTVMYNPETLSIKLDIERDESQGPGTTSSRMGFRRIHPQDYRIEFYVDGTGASTGIPADVPASIMEFLNVVYDYNSEEHRPNYVMIRYGSVLLKTVLKSVEITYNVFSPNGKPLRARVDTTFTSCLDPNLSEMINNPSSSDLTHKRVAGEDEKLAGMAWKIYKDNRFYQDVARLNGFDNFRHLPKGTEVIFPPVRKSNNKAK
jgi:hypothetical protein